MRRPRRLILFFWVVAGDRLGVTGYRLAAEHSGTATAVALSTWGAAVPMRHASVLSDSVGLEGALLSGDTIDMHRAVATLGCDILIERVPCYALDVMRMFSNFVYTFSCCSMLR